MNLLDKGRQTARMSAQARTGVIRLLLTLILMLIFASAAPIGRVNAMPRLGAPPAASQFDESGHVEMATAGVTDQGEDGDDHSGGKEDGDKEDGDKEDGDKEDGNKEDGDKEDGDEQDEWKGFIVARPDDLVGTWVVQIDVGVLLTVTTVTTTTFRPANVQAYAIGSWVEVDGVHGVNGQVVAKRIRLDDYEAGELVVRLQPTANVAAVAARVAQDYDLKLVRSLLQSADIYLFTTTDDDEIASVDELMQDARILWAEVNYVQSVPEGDGYKTWAWGGASEPEAYTEQSAYLQAGLGWEAKRFEGDNVVIAILDTGVYTAHEQFQGRLRLPTRDVIDDDTDASEVGPGLAWGHGTHVAGVIAAMAPAATLLPVRVLDQNGRGNTFLLAYAIEWAAQQPGVKVINLSLGTDGNSDILREVIRRVIEQGIIVVAAAGNGGVDTPQYPAAYPDVIGVTAVDGSNRKPPFANYGAALVDLAAPGVAIMSTMIAAEGPGYASWSGTSMSTAFVTGAVALLLDQQATAPMSTAEVLARLVTDGNPLDTLNPMYAGMLGRGLNVSGALGVVAPVPSVVHLPAMWR